MRNRLICLIVITALLSVFVSVFTFGVVASAEVIIEDNSATIEAGTYRWNDTLVYSSEFEVSLPFSLSLTPVADMENQTISLDNTPLYCDTIGVTLSSDGSIYMLYQPNLDPVYTGIDGWSTVNNMFVNSGFTIVGSLDGYGQTITVTEDTTYTDTDGIAFATWFAESTTQETPTPSTVTFDSGYYDLKVPYVNIEASWIGESGHSVYYPIQCQVVNGFNDYVECNGFGIEYISNENGYTTLWYVDIAGLRYDWFSLVTVQGADGVHTTSLRLLGGDYGLNTTKVYFPSSFEMEDGPGAVQFFSTFEVTDAPPYEGNVFFDIVDAVVEALDVDVFGYFSPLDVIKSIAGLMLGLWLLKLLAGG